MSSSFKNFPVRYPDKDISLSSFVVPFVYLNLSDSYIISDTTNSTNYLGKSSDTWIVVNDTTNAFDGISAEFLCQYTGPYTITPTLRDGLTCIYTTNLEIYPPDASAYSVRIEGGGTAATRKTSFTTKNLTKNTRLKIRLHLEATSPVNNFTMAGMTPQDVRTNYLPSENSIVTIQYNPNIILSSETTIYDIRHI